MELLFFPPDQFRVFLMVLVRISVILFLFPILGSTVFPTMAKAGLALVFAIILYPVVPVDPSLFPEKIANAGVMLVSELIVGMMLGLSVRIFFGAVQMAGQVIGFQMGFSMINVVDPMSGGQVSIMEQLGHWVVLVIFLLLNGHLIMISAVVESFGIINIGTLSIPGDFFNSVMNMVTEMFILGIKIGAPAIAALLFTSTAFGITAKFAPQMNVLIVAFPLKIAMGLVFFGSALNIILLAAKGFVGKFHPLLSGMMKLMGGG